MGSPGDWPSACLRSRRNWVAPGAFSECRLATLVHARGLDLAELPWPKKRNITWRGEFVRWDVATPAYHPAKALTPRDDL